MDSTSTESRSVQLAIAIMILTTLLTSNLVLAQGVTQDPITDKYYFDIRIYAILWTYIPPRIHFFDPVIVFTYLPLNTFNILFGVAVIRYLQNRTTKRRLALSEILSLIVPTLISLPFLFIALQWAVPPYHGPVPIQLLIGVFLARLFGPKEIVHPWLQDDISHWWNG